MKHRLMALVAALTLLVGGLTACKKGPQKFSSHSFDYFDTVSTVTGYADSQEEFDAVAQQAMNLLKEYHQLYNIYLRYEGMNNLCTVNELVFGSHRTVTVDRKIIDLLLYAREMYNKTSGMVNVAMGSVLKLWHDHRAIGLDDPTAATLPDSAALAEAAKHTDISKMMIDEQNNTVTLTDPDMRLDVGAIAKGYAVEQVARALEAQGITGYVLNVGGNVRTIGVRGDGTPWLVGLEDPADNEKYLAYLQLDGQALVTSGSYQRYYIVDGQSYHHIIHPATQMPATGWQSVSVLCKDSGLADALSTALFCMGLEQGQALVASLTDVEVHWVADDGTRTATDGWQKYVKQGE